MVNKQSKRQTPKKKRGFTLVELVIVIAVIAVLAAVLIPTFSNVIDNANRTKDEANAKIMTTELITKATLDGIAGYTPQEARALVMQTNAAQTTKSKNTSYWYNQATNQVELKDTAAMFTDPAAAAEASLGRVTAYADEEKTYDVTIYSLAWDSKYVYISGDENLDKVADTLSNLTAYAKLNAADNSDVTAQMISLHESLGSLISGLDEDVLSSEGKAFVGRVLSSFDPTKTLYFDNTGIYGASSNENQTYSNYVITNGTTKIAAAEKEYRFDEKVTIAFPTYCTTNSNSLNNLKAATDGETINVTVPAKTSAAEAVVKQAITDLVEYKNANESVTDEKVLQLIKDSHDGLSTSGAVTSADLEDLNVLIEKVESSVGSQISTPAINTNVNVSTNVQNKVQYGVLNFEYSYIQSEIRALSGRNTLYFRSNNTVTGGTEQAVNGILLDATIKGSAIIDRVKDQAALKTAYGVSEADAIVSSEYLIPTLKMSLKEQLAELGLTSKLSEGDKVEVVLKNYTDYGVIEGACVFYQEDNVVSYTIKPAMYIKRIVLNYAEADSINGLYKGYFFTLPDVSKSVNLSNMKVHAVVDGVVYDMKQIDRPGSFAHGKYVIVNNDGSLLRDYTDKLTEVYVEDNGKQIVYRQFI